jgi:hypothetical protein
MPGDPVTDSAARAARRCQIAFADEMNANSLTVPRFEHMAGGVELVAGKDLASHLAARPARLDPELVQRLARLADHAFRAPLPWEDPTD